MTPKTTLAILALTLALAGQALAVDPPKSPPYREAYQSQPFAISGVTIPEVLMVVSKNLKMFQQGYPGLVDLDGDGRIDTGFNPSVEYVGYFDSRSCYSYTGKLKNGYNDVFMAGDPDGVFKRAGAAVEDQTQDQINSARPNDLKSYVPSPRSPFGVCYNPSTNQSVKSGNASTFSGNWLNFIATSRIDAIRKILYGGKRKVDTEKMTVLEPSYVPADSTTWGTEIRSDDTWMEITPLSAYHDIRKYTPFEKPVSKKAHFVARGSDMGYYNKCFGALRVLTNADKSDFNVGGPDSVNARVAVTEPYGRYWDWVLVNRPLPDDRVLKSDPWSYPKIDSRGRIEVYNLQVEVCAKGNIGPEEGCDRFSGSDDSEVWKPGGLLQRYGSGATQMSFGLLTGQFAEGHAFKNGGMLRNHVGPVMGTPPTGGYKAGDVIPAVNAKTGQILEKGLIRNLDNLMVAGRDIKRAPPQYGFYDNTRSWGNPLGEMLYEAVRYMAGASDPTESYSKEPESDVASSTNLLLTSFRWAGAGKNVWKAGRPTSAASNCVKPVIMLISDVTTEFDDDSVGADINRPLIKGTKPPTGFTEGANLPQQFNWQTYLDTITRLEGLNTTGSIKYIYSDGPKGTCMPKAMSSLKQVSGVCPVAQSFQGSYSVVAAAYYAHIHDFNLSTSSDHTPTGVDIYAVTMSAAFPELAFAVKDASGKTVKSVNILPTNVSDGATPFTPSGVFLGVLNYFVLEWDTDRNGQVFHAKIKVNFSDRGDGDDWEGDGQVTYEIDLLADASVPLTKRSFDQVAIDAGELRDGKYYVFKNPSSADSREDFIDIGPDDVKALRIRSSWDSPGTSVGMGLGYTISGTTRDGPYLDITMNNPPVSKYLTPKDCPYVDGPTTGTYGCGKRVVDHKPLSRVFAFGTGASVQQLPSTMWLAAKYGGFEDLNHNGAPDPGEWEDAEGKPRNLFQTTNLSELPEKLESAFLAIARSITTGTATSASVNSVMGGGVSVHTAYYPRYVNPDNSEERLDWVGSVYGLFVDKWGNLREDTNKDHELVLATGDGSGDGDNIVTFNSVTTPPAKEDQPACYVDGAPISRCGDEFGRNNPVPLPGSAGRPANIHKLDPVWDTGRWLAELDAGVNSVKLLETSRPWATPATKALGQRRIYFGQPSTVTLGLFNTSPVSMDVLKYYLIHSNWAEHMAAPTGVTPTRDAIAAKLVQYVQGVDVPGWRSRTVTNPWSASPARVVWRLGDVINSKPIVVGPPASNFDTLYGDGTYAAWRVSAGQRRQMVYFGANDGMLHAVNAGYYGTLATGTVGYDPLGPGTKHELGAEVWAYVPASVLPHLKWLADPSYLHAYTVDMKPLVADIKIGGQWKTVLIGGLRLGGRPIDPPVASSKGSSEGPFYSEIFCLDVTDPESEPQLLWRYSSEEMGLSVGLPVVVSSGGKFYAVIPSGPKTDTVQNGKVVYGATSPFDGVSEQRARLIVLDAATGAVQSTGENLMVPASEGRSFFNDPFMPKAVDTDRTDNAWNDHAVYYGLTISQDTATCLDKGAVYRLRMVNPEDWTALSPSAWKLERLISVDRPVTGAVNSTRDPHGNLWVVFATGRLWGQRDLAPCSPVNNSTACVENHRQYLFGIKEELDPATNRMKFTDRTPQSSTIMDLTGVKTFSDGKAAMPDEETVAEASKSYVGLAAEILDPGVIGYKRELDMGRILLPDESHAFEINFTQPKVLALGNGRSLLAFTTFEPMTAKGFCGEIGQSYMYILDTFTGLPSPDLASIFATESQQEEAGSGKPFAISGGMLTGKDLNTEATIFIGDGVVTIGTSAADNSHYEKKLPYGMTPGNSLISWREAINTGFTMSSESMTLDLDPTVAP